MQIEPKDRPPKEDDNKQFLVIVVVLGVLILTSLYLGGAFDGQLRNTADRDIINQRKQFVAKEDSTPSPYLSEDPRSQPNHSNVVPDKQQEIASYGNVGGVKIIIGKEIERVRTGYEVFGYLGRYLAVCPTTESAAQRLLTNLHSSMDLSQDSKIPQAHRSLWMLHGSQKFNAEKSQIGKDRQCSAASESLTRFLERASSSGWDRAFSKWEKRSVFDDVRLSINYFGNCRYRVGGRGSYLPCDSLVVFYNYKTLYSEFLFGAKDDFYAFSGRKERQTNYENYTLFINHYDAMRQGKLIEGIAEGDCKTTQNTEASVFYSVTCQVKISDLPMEFVLDDIYNHVQTKFLE